MPIIKYQQKSPAIGESVYIAPGAYIIGEVEIGGQSSIWFNAVLRGDLAKITVGSESNIQDNATIHVDPDTPTCIGSRVTVGHNAVLHGCTVEDGALIGIGAVILNNAVIGKDSLVAAGSLITPGTIIPPRSLVMGSPGKVMRELSEDKLPQSGGMYAYYMMLADNYRQSG